MNVIHKIEKEQFKKLAPFKVGDTIKVHTRVVEGDKERIQVFTGIVIGRKGSGLNENFTVRRISYGEGVERVFPLHSPRIAKIEVERTGHVRRAKLNYLRQRQGKQAMQVKESKDRIEAAKDAKDAKGVTAVRSKSAKTSKTKTSKTETPASAESANAAA